MLAAARKVADHVEILFRPRRAGIWRMTPGSRQTRLDADLRSGAAFLGRGRGRLARDFTSHHGRNQGSELVNARGHSRSLPGPKSRHRWLTSPKAPNVTIDQRKYATVVIAGPQPVEGDQHRPDKSLDPYYAVAKALEPLFIKAHPDFPSEQWVKKREHRRLDPSVHRTRRMALKCGK